MNLNSNALFNRIEIIYYSALTSCLSGVERIRELVNRRAEPSQYPIGIETQACLLNAPDYSDKIKVSRWTDYYQTFISLTIWIILGFAAGFLIGLINPK